MRLESLLKKTVKDWAVLAPGNSCLRSDVQAKVAAQKGRPLLCRKTVLGYLPLQEAPRHTQRAEGCAEQHYGCSTIGNLAARRSKEADVRDVPYGIVEGYGPRADKRFVSRDAIESIDHPLSLDITVLDQYAVQSHAAASEIP